MVDVCSMLTSNLGSGLVGVFFKTGGDFASRERERDLLQVPHFFVGTLQPR